MAVEVLMPKLGLTMEQGTIIEWMKREGDTITTGEVLFQIEMEKATMDIEAQVDGVLGRILIPEGETVPVGTVVAHIVAAGEAPPEAEAPTGAARAQVASESAKPAEKSSPEGGHEAAPDQVIKASPIAKRLARSAGIDLATVRGTGPGGRIVEADVRRAMEETAETPTVSEETAKAEPESSDIEAVSGVRRVIAERMSRANAEAPQVTLMSSADATALVALRSALNSKTSQDRTVSYNDLLVLVVAHALREHPGLNARMVGNEIHRSKEIHIGVAVDTDRGLIVPVIRNAGQLSLEQIREIGKSLVAKVQQGEATPDELSGGTFTITNLGAYGIDHFTPIINLPECAILGVGRIAPTVVPILENTAIGIRQMMGLSLTFDHRLVDGAPAARFLERVVALIEEPAGLLGGSS